MRHSPTHSCNIWTVLIIHRFLSLPLWNKLLFSSHFPPSFMFCVSTVLLYLIHTLFIFFIVPVNWHIHYLASEYSELFALFWCGYHVCLYFLCQALFYFQVSPISCVYNHTISCLDMFGYLSILTVIICFNYYGWYIILIHYPSIKCFVQITCPRESSAQTNSSAVELFTINVFVVGNTDYGSLSKSHHIYGMSLADFV